MKVYALVTLCLFANLFASTAQKTPDSIPKLKVFVKNQKGHTVHLKAYSLNGYGMSLADSAVIKTDCDTITLKGKLTKEENWYSLAIDNSYSLNPILEKNHTTELYFDYKNLPNPYEEASLYKNSPSSVDFNRALSYPAKWLRQKYILKQNLSDSSSDHINVQRKIDSLSDLIVSAHVSMLSKTNSVATVWRTLQYLQYEETMKPYNELLEKLKQRFPESDVVKNKINWFNEFKFTHNEVKFSVLENGLYAPDLELEDLDGMRKKLSSYRGSFILIDFWASWCTPCRNEAPFLKEAFAKYKGRRFKIIQVSIDRPEDLGKWKDAIKEDQVEEFIQTHVDRTQQLYKDYKIESIPTNYLISPEGKIIDSNLRGGLLLPKLDNALPKSK